jgi:hypothetical protein
MPRYLDRDKYRPIYINYGRHFMEREGRPPSRLDWRGENLQHYREAHGITYPSAKQIETIFRRWGRFVEAIGARPNSTKIAVGRAAIRFLKENFGLEEEDFPMGAYDGTINGRTVEVKGSTISKEKTFGHVRWRFRFHHRQYSKLCDELWLVGLDDDRPLAVWRLKKADMMRFVDERDALSIAVRCVFKNVFYPLHANIVWKAPLTKAEIDEILSRGKEPPQWPYHIYPPKKNGANNGA